MKNFSSIEEFYREKQRQSGLFTDHVFSGKQDMQYLAEQERAMPDTIPSQYRNMQLQVTETEKETLDTIPDEAIIAIKRFDAFNSKNQSPYVGYNELEVCLSVWSRHIKKTLLYALNNGTAYTIENGSIYIWYKPFKGFDGAGFYKLKRFVFLNDRRCTVKYFLDGDEKLSNPL